MGWIPNFLRRADMSGCGLGPALRSTYNRCRSAAFDAEGELVSLPGRGVVAEAWLCGAGRGRRDRAAACRRADHGSRAEGAAVGAPSRLGRCVACLDFAGAQALADRAPPETRPLLAKRS